jgi:alpha-D-ribose 1-methylphosphonate 5-triphosphate synthase subunit PhnG
MYFVATVRSMTTVSARQEWLRALSCSTAEELAELADALIAEEAIDAHDLRRPEIGLVLSTGRVGANGEPFGLGEVTVTRCVVQVGATMGVGYVRGRDHAHARRVAVLDALLQGDKHALVRRVVLDELMRRQTERHQSFADDIAGSRVHFLTMVRGE